MGTKPRLADEPQVVIDRYLSGDTLATIANDYGVSRQTVYSFLHRRGITDQLRRDRIDAQVAELHAQGWNASRIAREVGRSRTGTGIALTRKGLSPHPFRNGPILGPEQVQECIRRHQAGESVRKIADSLGVSPGLISQVMIKAGHRTRSPKPRGNGVEDQPGSPSDGPLPAGAPIGASSDMPTE